MCLTIYTCKAQPVKKTSDEIAFKQIDSVVNANQGDTIFYCSPYLIKKIEEVTKIDATDKGGSYVGKLFFTKADYEKWDNWRVKKNRKNMKGK
jgi:hypothetical protein